MGEREREREEGKAAPPPSSTARKGIGSPRGEVHKPEGFLAAAKKRREEKRTRIMEVNVWEADAVN